MGGRRLDASGHKGPHPAALNAAPALARRLSALTEGTPSLMGTYRELCIYWNCILVRQRLVTETGPNELGEMWTVIWSMLGISAAVSFVPIGVTL